MIAYLDTSAALRVLVAGPGSDALRVTRRTQRYLDRLVAADHTLASSVLLRTEILCQANRQPEIEMASAEHLLSRVNLVELSAGDLDDAPRTPGRLRTLDAIHLTAAVRIGADLVIAYDDELRRAAQTAGLRVGPEPA